MAENGYSGTTAAHDAEEQRVKKRNKMILYIVLFAIFQVGVITVFSLTVMKVQTPKLRVVSASLAGVSAGAPANSSFAATMTVQLSIKNRNFGQYKFDDFVVWFLHGGSPVGQGTVKASSVNMRSTKKIEVVVDLKIEANAELASDLGKGVVALDSSAKMSGKVTLMFVMKKKSKPSMNCSMENIVATSEIKNIACK